MMNRTIPKIGAAVANGTGGNFYGADRSVGKQKMR